MAIAQFRDRNRPRAAQDLADLVERVASKQAPLVVGPASQKPAVNFAQQVPA